MQNEPTLDCRGLACPGPVMRCLEAIEQGAPGALLVLVDDPAARENVTRLLSGKGYNVAVAEAVGHSRLHATRLDPAPSAVPAPAASPCASGPDMVTVFIASETIGAGDDGLGGKLMLNLLATLPELGRCLWRVILVNGGVRLATANHPCLEKLQALAAAGVSVLVCGTCLTHFGLLEARQVGETTNMLDVVMSLHLAGKVIRV